MTFIDSLNGLNLAALTQAERWALLSVAERMAAYVVMHRDAINSPDQARALVRSQLIGAKQKEVFLVVFLDSQNGVIGCEQMFHGTIDSCAVYPREVVKRSLELNASTIIVAHNHPSGSSDPSDADRNITKRLREALALVDVKLVDHLVVGDRIVSFAERGWL